MMNSNYHETCQPLDLSLLLRVPAHRCCRRLTKCFQLDFHLVVKHASMEHLQQQVCVPEHLLHQADLAGLAIDIGGEGMAQGVW